MSEGESENFQRDSKAFQALTYHRQTSSFSFLCCDKWSQWAFLWRPLSLVQGKLCRVTRALFPATFPGRWEGPSREPSALLANLTSRVRLTPWPAWRQRRQAWTASAWQLKTDTVVRSRDNQGILIPSGALLQDWLLVYSFADSIFINQRVNWQQKPGEEKKKNKNQQNPLGAILKDWRFYKNVSFSKREAHWHLILLLSGPTNNNK